MKKYFIAIMVLVLAFTLMACNGTSADTTVNDNATEPNGTEPTVTEPVETEHVHNFVDEIIQATCSSNGKALSKCECGEVQSEINLPKGDHIPSALDCEKDTVCTVCNTVIASKTGHTVTSTEVITAATCNTPGKEKGVCSVCAKEVEIDVLGGHKASSESAWTLVDGKFSTTCVICNQTVTMQETAPVISLDFDTEIGSELANYKGFNAVGNFASKKEFGNSMGIYNNVVYLDVTDNSVIANLGTYVISFDVMVTKDNPAGAECSVFSILTNFEGGKNNGNGTTNYSYAFKHNQDLGKFELIKVGADAAKLNDKNSISVVKDTKYNVKILVAEGATKYLVYFNDIACDKAGCPVPSFNTSEKISFRFGDGPNPGLVFDNFKIVGLK